MFDHQEKAFFLYLKILNVVDRLKNEPVSEAGNDSEFNFLFHIHELDADYRKSKCLAGI